MKRRTTIAIALMALSALVVIGGLQAFGPTHPQGPGDPTFYAGAAPIDPATLPYNGQEAEAGIRWLDSRVDTMAIDRQGVVAEVSGENFLPKLPLRQASS